jgi:hypothetical protein
MAMIHVSRSGATLGVFDEAKVREGLTTGEFIGTDLGWTEGMATWRPLSELESFLTPPPAAAAVPSPAATPATEAAPTYASPAIAPTTATSATRTGLPWENRSSSNFFNALFDTIVMVLTKPFDAFAVMRREGGLTDPLLYMLIMGVAGALVSFVYSTFMHLVGLGASGDAGLGRLMGMGATSFVALIFTPVLVIVGLFIGSAIVHVCLMIVGGANQSFETTLRVLAFGNGSTAVFQIIPFCGGFVAGIYSLVVNCIGLSRAHETDLWRAVVAILLPVVVCCGGITFIVIAFFGGLAALSGSH